MKNFLNKFWLAAGLVLLSNMQVNADAVDLDRIVVTSSRVEENLADVSRNVDVITASDIRDSQSRDLAGLLNELTSMNINAYGGLGQNASIRMRGSSAAQVLVMVDGRPVNSPRDGEVDLSTIPLDNVERIEVMHGPGSSLYGASAMGGVVNIITKNPPEQGMKSELVSGFGSFRTYTETFANGAKIDDFGYLLTGGYHDSEGFRDNSEFNDRDLNAKLAYDFNRENRLTLNSGFYRSKSGAPGSLVYPDSDDRKEDLKNFQDLEWGFDPDELGGFSIKGYQNYEKLRFMENSAGSAWDIAGKVDRHTTKSRGANIQADRQVTEAYQIIAGADYTVNLNNSTSTAKHKYIVRAAYLENKLDLLEKFKFNFGARVDDYSNFGTQIDPSFGLLYAFREDLKFRGSVSRSFRAPTFNDLYWPDDGWSKGNPNLSPEKGLTKEIGLEKQFKKLASGLTFFRSDYKDLINWVTDEFWVSSPQNVNSARIEGAEWKNKFKINDEWSAGMGYTLLRARDKQTHKNLVYQPRHKLDLSLDYKDDKGFFCGLKGQFVGRKYSNTDNTEFVKDFFILGIALSKRFTPNLTCFGSLDNILNEKYKLIQGYPMPGFSVNAGVKCEF